MITAHSLHRQGKLSFAELFGTLFPYGVHADEPRTMTDYRCAIRANLFLFDCNERFHVHCRCGKCSRDEYVDVWDIAEALAAQNPLDCRCGQGGLVPLYKEKAAIGA